MNTKNICSKQLTNIFRLSFIIFFFSTIFLFAQENSDTEYDLPQTVIDNYIKGAQSDNEGLKASCIYFLGKFRVLEANTQLIDEIHNTDDDNVKILLVWSLFRIGEEAGINELEQIAISNESDDLKAFALNLHSIKMLEKAPYE